MSKWTGSAGASIVNITPIGDVDSFGGTPLRRNEKEDSDLLAQAVVFSDERSTGAVVSMDLTMFGRATALAMREACSLRTGIPASHITITANHVHVAPRSGPGFLFRRSATDPLYMDYLQRRVVESVEKAQANMRPARIAAGTARTEGLSFNRRYLRPDGRAKMVFAFDRDPSLPPEGPADPELGYVLFEEPDGTPIALMTSFSAHNHVVGGCPVPGRGPDEYFHRDFGGRFGDVIRQRLGDHVAAVYLPGASGNTAWQDPSVPPPVDGAAAAWEIGEKLAEAFVSSCEKQVRTELENVQFAAEVVAIPDRTLDESQFCGDHCDCRGSTEEIHAVDRERYGVERAALEKRQELGDTDTWCIAELGAIAIGGLAISTNPAELFVEFGLDIKKRSPYDLTLVSSLSNGHCGYVPTEQAFEHGGYETHRSVFTSRLVKNAGNIIADGCIKALERCREMQSQQDDSA